MNPLISIIIPTFNRADLLCETLDSVLSQNYENWECIVVDDGSNDNSEEVIQKYVEKDARFRFYKRPEYLPKSGSSCRNYGFEVSKGSFVNFFDSDDIMLPEFLSSRIYSFDDNIQMVLATYRLTDEHLNFKSESKFIPKDYLLKDYMFWRMPILTPSVLFRKEYLINKRLFNPEIKRGQETDFFLNVLRYVDNNQYKLIEKPTFLYRLHDNTITAKTKTYNKDYSESLLKIRSKAYFLAEELKDEEFIKNSHLHLIMLLFKAIKNKDFNAANVLKKYYLKKNRRLTQFEKIEITTITPLLTLIGLTPKKLEKRWINFI